MLEIVKYIFSDWRIYIGILFFIIVLGEVIADIVSAFKNKKGECDWIK